MPTDVLLMMRLGGGGVFWTGPVRVCLAKEGRTPARMDTVNVVVVYVYASAFEWPGPSGPIYAYH